MFKVMFFGLIDTSKEARERRAEARLLRVLKRRTHRDKDGVPFIAGAYVIKDGSTRPRPVRASSPEEIERRPTPEPTEEDKEMSRRFVEIMRLRQAPDASAGTVVGSAEGTMSFTGYATEGPEGADLREGVARRRVRLFGPDESPTPVDGETARGRRDYRSQNLLYG